MDEAKAKALFVENLEKAGWEKESYTLSDETTIYDFRKNHRKVSVTNYALSFYIEDFFVELFYSTISDIELVDNNRLFIHLDTTSFVVV